MIDYKDFFFRRKTSVYEFLKKHNVKDLEKAKSCFSNFGLTVPEDNVLLESLSDGLKKEEEVVVLENKTAEVVEVKWTEEVKTLTNDTKEDLDTKKFLDTFKDQQDNKKKNKK